MRRKKCFFVKFYLVKYYVIDILSYKSVEEPNQFSLLIYRNLKMYYYYF